MSNDAITTGDLKYDYDNPPPNTHKKVILLTTGKVAIIEAWGTGEGVIAWCPLPKRDKQYEKEKGL